MKKKSLLLLAICLLLVTPLVLTGCGTKTFKNVGEWETQKVSKIYTHQELSELSDKQLETLEKTYIKVKTKFKSSNIVDNSIYYVNRIYTITVNNLEIGAYDFHNYWELKFSYDDDIYIEGWVLKADTSYNLTDLRISPAYVTKA